MVTNLSAMQETRVRSPGQEDPWRGKWLPTPVFLLAEFPGKRSLVSSNPWGCKESDTTESFTLSSVNNGFHFSFRSYFLINSAYVHIWLCIFWWLKEISLCILFKLEGNYIWINRELAELHFCICKPATVGRMMATQTCSWSNSWSLLLLSALSYMDKATLKIQLILRTLRWGQLDYPRRSNPIIWILLRTSQAEERIGRKDG